MTIGVLELVILAVGVILHMVGGVHSSTRYHSIWSAMRSFQLKLNASEDRDDTRGSVPEIQRSDLES
jgi:hypothetical protein